VQKVTVSCELTDALECLLKLYDPYADSDPHPRPHVSDFETGAKAAEYSVVHDVKDDVTGLINKPREGFHRHGILGERAGAIEATSNMIVKPAVGNMASATGLTRGIYAKHSRHSDSSNRLSVLSGDGQQRASSESLNSEEETSPDVLASLVSGLSLDVCRKIVADFKRIKTERNLKPSTTQESNN
jgi:hypothetical protein